MGHFRIFLCLSMIPRLVPEIDGGTLSVTEEKEQKDWSWSILVVGGRAGLHRWS